MRLLKRDSSLISFCLCIGKTPNLDANNYETGEYSISYDSPITLNANVADSGGTIQEALFGTDFICDKLVLFENVNLKIDANTVFFIDKPYEIDNENICINYEGMREVQLKCVPLIK